MTVNRFGTVDETDILEIAIASGAGADARIITWGAVLRDLVVAGPRGPQRVVLGLNSVEDYVAHSPYFGAIVGRYANRIAGARFDLDGEAHQLVPNENGNQLHGGPEGFGTRPWSLVEVTASSATLALVSPDGDMGYPGRLVAVCTYAFVGPATLRIVLEATCDRATPVNLTTHSYYNLDGGPDILGHRLTLAADHVTPTDQSLIPTGEIRSVAGTPHDFRHPRLIGDPADRGGVLYDTNFVLRHAVGTLAPAAILSSNASGIAMELWTTEPGVQFYDGHLIDLAVPGLDGIPYRRFGGLCLEPQRFPDGPNEPHFPPCILRPGVVSRQVSELRFRPA